MKGSGGMMVNLNCDAIFKCDVLDGPWCCIRLGVGCYTS